MPSEIQLYRYELVKSALLAGVALSKVDAMRPFLEKYGHRLTSRAQLREVIPAILDRVKETSKEELKSVKEVLVILTEWRVWAERLRSWCVSFKKTFISQLSA